METNITLFLFILLLQLSSSRSYAEECKLKPVQEHLNCTLYKLKNDECQYPSLLNRFPELYNITSDFPGTPHYFNASVDYDYEYKGVNYASVNLTFSPMQNVGIKYVKGFEISYYRSDTVDVVCYIFDLSEATWIGDINDKMTVFEKRIGPLAPEKIYTFELYALPKPHPDPLDDYKQLTFRVPPSLHDGSSANWVATIWYEKFEDDSEIRAFFNKPPEKFNLSQFYFMLKNVDTDTIVTRNLTNQTSFIFTQVKPGNYSIRVKPHDPFPDDNDKCLCKTSKPSCISCTTTITEAFEMNSVVKTTTPPTSQNPPLKQQHPETEDSITGIKIGLSILGGVLGVALAVVAFFIYMHRRNGDNDQYVMDKTQKDGQDNEGCMDNISIITADGKAMYSNNLNANKIKFKRRLKLFMLYEEDHEQHRQVVNSFATYLQQHCQCDVMCAEWHLDTPWVHEDLNRADFIIVINSEKAYNSYMEEFGRSSTGQMNGRRSSSINSIRNKFLQDERYDNIVMVYFDYTDKKYLIPDICPGYKYKLLENFTEFLLHIHKLHRTDDLSQYDLPFDGNHNLRPIGKQLIDAIVGACLHENRPPRNALAMLRTVSKISDPDGQLDSGLPEDLGTPGATPCTEGKEPVWQTDVERHLLQYLEGTSSDAVTISPSVIQQIEQTPTRSDPGPNHLSPLVIGQPVGHMTTPVTSSPPTASSTGSEFDFLPPDDMSDYDADAVSRSQSEQMKCIVDRYHAINRATNYNNPNVIKGSNSSNKAEQLEPLTRIMESQQQQPAGYNPDADLHLLKLRNGDLILTVEEGDSVSLGGQSV